MQDWFIRKLERSKANACAKIIKIKHRYFINIFINITTEDNALQEVCGSACNCILLSAASLETGVSNLVLSGLRNIIERARKY